MIFSLEVFILLVPLIVGGVLHMGLVTLDWLKFLKIPIHEKMFGKNKTYRGFIAMPLLTIPGVYLAVYLEKLFEIDLNLAMIHPLLLGTLLGVFYCIFELPNSFIKRRKGIAPGKMSKDDAIFHAIFDQVDSGFGLVIIFKLYSSATYSHLFAFLLVGLVIHLLLNYLLYKLGLRKEPL